MRSIGLRLLILPLAVTALAACTEHDRLDMHRSQWLETGPRHGYHFELENLGFGRVSPYDAWIRVEHGTVVEVSEFEPALEPALSSYPTIDELFDVVQRQLDAGHEIVELEYDLSYDYPTHVLFAIGNEAGGFRVSRLEPL